MAKNYIDNLSEEISKGLHEGLEQGFWPFQPPYGYIRGAKKSLVIDKARVMYVHRAFELFSTGKYSLRKLSEKLLEEGYYYKVERPKITACVLESMLKNVIYVGQMSCNGIIYQGKHPAIVTRKTFDKAQEAFARVDKSKVRKNFDFLYSGIAKCGVCGYAFCAEIKKKHNIYYRCSHYDRSCPNIGYVTEKSLTQALRMHIKKIGLTNELYELVKYSIKAIFGDEQEYHKQEVNRLNEEIEHCKEMLKKMYLDQINNVLDYELWIKLKNEYEIKFSRLNAELQKHSLANTNFLDTGLKILDVCKRASLPSTELTEHELSQIVRETYLSVTIQDKKVKMLFKEPFATIENLVKYAKKEIAEVGMAEFKSQIISSKDEVVESIKKEPNIN